LQPKVLKTMPLPDLHPGARAGADSTTGAADEPAGHAFDLTPRPSRWTADVFRALPWQRFQAVCARLFDEGGNEMRPVSRGPGGLDIWVHSRHGPRAVAIVRCHHGADTTGVQAMREFNTVIRTHRLQHGTCVAPGGFTADALAFARNNDLSVLDGDGLVILMGRRTPQKQRALLALAYGSDCRFPDDV